MQQAREMDNEQEGNTEEIRLPWDTNYMQIQRDMWIAFSDLCERMGYPHHGEYKVTIEFYPDTEDEVEDGIQ